MDAAADNPFEDRRFRWDTSSRRVSMKESLPKRSLTESEFERAVADGLPKLISIARRLAGDEDLAAEAVQNALLKASKSWRRFEGRSHVHTWLTKILLHCIRDAIAAQRRRPEASQSGLGEDSDLGQRVIDRDAAPDEKLQRAETRRVVRDAVANLPDRQREVFSLMVWQNLSAKEVAALLEIDPQNVHANLYAARKSLRESLSHLNRFE